MKAENILFLLFFTFAPRVNADLYTSLAHLEDLQQTESVLIEALKTYIYSLEEKIISIQNYYNDFHEQHKSAAADIESYLANPINIYLLIKRLTTDWVRVESLVFKEAEKDFAKNVSYYKEKMKIPSDEDLKGAAVAIGRLQKTYLLDAALLARGEIDGVQYSSKLTAADCFELGKQLFEKNEYYYAQLWMQEADARLEEEFVKTMERQMILEYWAAIMYKQGNIPSALNITNKLLELIPSHQKALKDKIYYDDVIKNSQNIIEGKDENESEDWDDVDDIAAQLCRKEISLSIHTVSKLKCYYVTNNKPFLLIAPFKVEEAHDDPKILLFHDVITDGEIETIKTLAHPKLHRAQYSVDTDGDDDNITWTTGDFRINKVSFLYDAEHETIENLSRRLSDMTSLSTESAEMLQVASYGTGGFFRAHTDPIMNENEFWGNGDRIATLIFYMNDVAQGGATVFPRINVTVWPTKGTAVFWYNLHTNGEVDSFTIHAACPVLAGSKWICNKWLHEVGQEFIRPCGLEKPPRDRVEDDDQ